jgi:hypothetical protein
VKIRYLLTALAGGLFLLVSACSDTRRSESAPSGTPAASADRVDNDTWARERDAYVTRRERELEEYDQRWENFKAKANAKSRRAWADLKEETSGMRRELSELRASSKENWEEAKRKMDSGWEKFEGKVRDVFDGDDHP